MGLQQVGGPSPDTELRTVDDNRVVGQLHAEVDRRGSGSIRTPGPMITGSLADGSGNHGMSSEDSAEDR
eukprot:2835601-Rhodomonas_salina.2